MMSATEETDMFHLTLFDIRERTKHSITISMFTSYNNFLNQVHNLTQIRRKNMFLQLCTQIYGEFRT